MLLEYCNDVSPDQRPVLLTYGTLPSEAELLRMAAMRLAANEHQGGLQIEKLAGFRGLDGCSLLAEMNSTKLGVVPIDDAERAFRCVLDPSGWHRVAGLLEPFVAARPTLNPNGFQYLDESGPIDWIISGSRSW
jgi:hypothetical protein